MPAATAINTGKPIYPEAAVVAGPEDLVVEKTGSVETRFLRSHSFLIAWSEVSAGGATLEADSPTEYFAMLPGDGATLTWSGGERAVPGHTVCVMPRGKTSVRFRAEGECVRVFSPTPSTFEHIPIYQAGQNQAAMPPLRDIVRYQRVHPTGEPLVYELDKTPNSVGMPRAKLFQSETMSINWVEYKGPRDRKNLSPHAHTDFEQASIAIDGTFVHHYRTTWVVNADKWREDEHVVSGRRTIALIPPPIIHTSEGIGDMRHILVDVFAPPRPDFIAKGQVLNAAEYRAPAGAKAGGG